MTYMVQRRFKGSAVVDPQELDRIVGRELVPQLKQLPGFVRYVTSTFDDGCVGSMSVFENEESAERSNEAGLKFVSETLIMQDYKHDATLGGVVVATIQGDRPQTAGYTISRQYRTDASQEDLAKVFSRVAQAFKEKATGLVRWSAVALTGGGLITYGWFDSAENARKSTQVAADLTSGDSDLVRVLPRPPEDIRTGKMLTVYT
ncbi:MAG: hypothetical protein QOG25_1806 [Acetobacteraceae bacterium]|jgi:hypothetical protein|nr:hypothetical protein [Acetobacteraceae bacterium]